jgi:predicted DNA-binding protein (MmcQ/YjbR family)
MHIEEIRSFCLKLPGATEDIKWGNDLCFCIAGKMFCVAVLQGPLKISFKVTDEEFDEVSNSDGFIPAPYVARHKWVLLEDPGKISGKKLQAYIKQSYELVKAKLSKKALKAHRLL